MNRTLLSLILLLGCAFGGSRLDAQVRAHTAPESSAPFPLPGSHLLVRQNEAVRAYVAKHPSMLATMRLSKTAAWNFNVGDTHAWYAHDFTNNTDYTVQSTCRAVGTNCYVFVEDANWGSRVSGTSVDSVRNAFDLRTPANPSKGVYRMDVDAFGNPPDVDSDPRIIILILDIRDGFSGSGGYVEGYFYSLNETTMPNSNRAEIYYLDCNPANLSTAGGLQSAMSTTAHEFQHMIHWNYDQYEETFVNEGCSLLAEVNCGYPIFDQSGYINETNHYLFDWRSSDNVAVLRDYSRAARFFTYLRDQAGIGVFKPLVASTAHGIAGIDAGLSAAGASQRFSDLFQTWPIANVLDDTTLNRAYGYVYPGLPKARGVDYLSPNVSDTTFAVAPLGVQYLLFKAGTSLQATFSNVGNGLQIKAVEKSASGDRVLDIVPGTTFTEPGFGSTYNEIDVAVINTSQSASAAFTVQAQGSGTGTYELKWDESEPVGYLQFSPGDTVCVVFDGSPGARLDSIRVALRRASTMTGGVWTYGGDQAASPLGQPLAVPITASISTTPSYPYPVPWPNWAGVDLRSHGLDASSPFTVAFVYSGVGSGPTDPAVMVTEYAATGPYHSYTYEHNPGPGQTPGWEYVTDTSGTYDYLYLIRAYVSFSQALTVYPGDANNDGVVDARDIIPIGIYYGRTGPTRSGGTTWSAQGVQSWNVAAASYADCDGNGKVDANDVQALITNWGRVTGSMAAPKVDRLDACQRLLDEIDRNAGGAFAAELRAAVLDYMTRQLGIVLEYRLAQNYPNPFNPTTTIRFTLPEKSEVRLTIFDILGRKVWEKEMHDLQPGSHEIVWNGETSAGYRVGSGVYFYRLSAGSFSAVRRMVVLK